MAINLQFPSNLVSDLQGVQIVDLRGKLPVNPNYTWEQLAGNRAIETLNTIVCHHDAIPKSKSANYSDVELAENIAEAHIRSTKNHPKGDPGFPYDLWIRNGVIYWCNDIETREYGVRNNNGYTVNVCVSGDYANFDSLTQVDRKALYAAIVMLQYVLPNDNAIKGHSEIVPTSCPGYEMSRVRADIAALQIKNEETEESTVVPSNRDKIQKMLNRTAELVGIYNDKSHKYNLEAERKLLAIDETITEKGFYK